MPATDGAVKLWTMIVGGLRQAGYANTVPEYLRLSRMLAQTRMTELVKGKQGNADQWNELRQLGSEAVRLLKPLLESAQILADLPAKLAPLPPTSSRGAVESSPPTAGGQPGGEGATLAEPPVEAVDRQKAPAEPRRKRATDRKGGTTRPSRPGGMGKRAPGGGSKAKARPAAAGRHC